MKMPLTLVATARRLWLALVERLQPTIKIQVIDGYELPATLPRRHMALLRDAGEDWAIGMRCPCGCGETIELALLPVVAPRWDLSVDSKGRPTLNPSIWKASGCRSHFWIRRGIVQWCDRQSISRGPSS